MNTEIGKVRLEIKEELNIFTAAAVRQQLLEGFERIGDIDIDLSGVSEIDCAGIQLLLSAKREAEIRSRTIHFIGLSQPVVEALTLIDMTLQIAENHNQNAQTA